MDAHFGVAELNLGPSKSARPSGASGRRQQLGRSQFSARPKNGHILRSTMGVAEESRLEKQLRKAVECYRQTNYFKAICCYHKVRLNLNLEYSSASNPISFQVIEVLCNAMRLPCAK